ncbi:unnamed protein product [Mortierella alpina]
MSFSSSSNHLFATLCFQKEYTKAPVQLGSTSSIFFSLRFSYNQTMKIATFAVAVLAIAFTVTLAAPVFEKRDLVDVNVAKVNVGKDGSIAKVKSTKVSVRGRGRGLVNAKTGGVNALDDTVVIKP